MEKIKKLYLIFSPLGFLYGLFSFSYAFTGGSGESRDTLYLIIYIALTFSIIMAISGIVLIGREHLAKRGITKFVIATVLYGLFAGFTLLDILIRFLEKL